jgi:TolB-like protein/Tfp pilus assembly protein PilF
MRKFGTFEIDLRARELRKGGIRIRLQDQPFEILAMMLDRPGEVVTREELRQRLWPAGTFVDFEHSLNAAVKRLRSALGDDADNPRFVETMHRRGYRFIAPVESPDNGSRGAAHAPVPRAIVRAHTEGACARLVVLPFANLSNDPMQEYFSDGLTEEMITQISRLLPNRLGVIARTSSMRFKHSGKSASEIGQELSVDYLLEGSVRREGDRVRITAQLIESRTETHLWAETYDRRLEESLLLQSDVAARIAQSLAMELVPDHRDALERVHPRQAEAYQAYLKGRFHWNRTGDEGLQTAITYYERALELDPGFAEAHAAMARGQIALADFSHQPGRDALVRARVAALRCLELDPGMADAHVALAEVQKSLDWNWTAAEATYRNALALSPSCDLVHSYYSRFLAVMSRLDEARREIDRAATLDPLCLAVGTTGAWVRYVAGDFEEAVERLHHTLEMDASYLFARRLLGAAYVGAGMHREGIAELERACRGHVPDDRAHMGGAVSLAWLAHARAAAGQRDDAYSLLRQLSDLRQDRYVPAYHVALVHTGLGDKDAAFGQLSQACAERDPAVIQVAVEPRFAPLRDDPRFAALLAELCLPSSAGVS